MKVRATSFLVAAIWVVFGAWTFVAIPRFRSSYPGFYDTEVMLPRLTRSILFLTPAGWLILACSIAVLIIYRDLSGRRWLFPNWAVLFMLIVCGVCVLAGLVQPLIVDLDYVESK